MTREEAIEILDNLIGMIEDNHNSDYDTAFKMAIQALEQEPSGDAVSRQFMKEMGATCIAKRNDMNELIPIIAIDALPSINSQLNGDEWEDGYKRAWAEAEVVFEKEPLTDQWKELKETITEMRDNDGTGTQQEACKFLVNYMDVLEKQMQEPKTGHWIVHEHAEEFYGRVIDNYECDNCGDWYLNKTNFCPNCGARMKEGD